MNIKPVAKGDKLSLLLPVHAFCILVEINRYPLTERTRNASNMKSEREHAREHQGTQNLWFTILSHPDVNLRTDCVQIIMYN